MSVVLAELKSVIEGLSAEKAHEVLSFARSLEQKQCTPTSDELFVWTEEDLRNWSLDSEECIRAELDETDWGGLIEDDAELSM